jgi:hypothetical protein
VAGLMIWLLGTIGVTVLSTLRSGGRIARFAVAGGERLDVDGAHPVYQLDDERVFACVAGTMRPVVVVSRGMCAALDDEQLEVVLAHEQAHATRHHNLALLATRVAERALFFVPGAKAAGRSIRQALETIADDAAAARTGDALAVAGAVARVAGLTARGSGARIQAAGSTLSAFAHEDLAVERVERLLFHRPQPRSRLRLASAAAAIVLLLLVVGSTGYAIGMSGLSSGSDAAACSTTSPR